MPTEDQISTELHSIYAVHHARHNVAMLRICRTGRDQNDLTATLKEISEEMQECCHCAYLLTTNQYPEFVEHIFKIMPPEDVESMRVMFKDAIESTTT